MEEPAERRAPNVADLQEAPEPIADPGHSTEERHAIAEQPTEMFDVEGQFEDAATESDAPSDDQLVDAEMAEPRLAPVDPLAGIEASTGAEADAPAAEEPADEFDEFFSEQRLSDELNQALEAPLPDEPGAPPSEEAPAVFVDLDEDAEVEEDAQDEEGDPAEEAPAEPGEDTPLPAPPAAGSSHEDVLEDTPEFLEDTPEDDNLWFEQKPPKDFDFDD